MIRVMMLPVTVILGGVLGRLARERRVICGEVLLTGSIVVRYA